MRGALNGSPRERVSSRRALGAEDLLDGVELLSLDVFDTALVRKVLAPTDVFTALERELVDRHGDGFLGFADVRSVAERGAEETLRERTPAAMPGLGEIYDWIGGRRPEWADHAAAARQLEMEIEAALLQADPDVLSLYGRARSAGIPAVFVSDMYLPEEFISQQLVRCGYADHRKVYVSHACSVSKYAGGLFDVVLRDCRVAPSAVLHVGDCPVSDGGRPRERGLRTIVIPKQSELLLRNPLWNAVVPKDSRRDLSVACLLGLQAAQSAREGSSQAYRIGFEVFGPLLAGFSHWLISNAASRNVGKLHFLSRDGWILKQAYDSFREGLPGAAESAYLYSSRRALVVAALRELDRDAMGVYSGYMPGTTIGDWLRSFRIDPAARPDVLRENGFRSDSDTIDHGMRHRVACVVRALSDVVLARAAEDREAYRTYLAQEGVLDQATIAVVDTGWSGTIQHCLESIVVAGDRRPQVVGLYVGLKDRAAGVLGPDAVARGYLFHMKSYDHSWQFLQEARVIEAFCSAPAPALRTVRLVDGVATPVFEESIASDLSQSVKEMQKGALDFVREFRAAQGRSPSAIPLSVVRALFERLLLAPTRDEARVLGSTPYDSWIGTEHGEVLARPTGSPVSRIAGRRLVAEYEVSDWRAGYYAQLGWMERLIVKSSSPSMWRADGFPSRVRNRLRSAAARVRRRPS